MEKFWVVRSRDRGKGYEGLAAHQDRAEQFVLAWQTCLSLQEICKITGKTPAQASNLARFYRTRNVPLKRFKKGSRGNGWDTRPLNFDRLRQIALELGGEEAGALADHPPEEGGDGRKEGR